MAKKRRILLGSLLLIGAGLGALGVGARGAKPHRQIIQPFMQPGPFRKPCPTCPGNWK